MTRVEVFDCQVVVILIVLPSDDDRRIDSDNEVVARRQLYQLLLQGSSFSGQVLIHGYRFNFPRQASSLQTPSHTSQ